jgi:N-acyl-D-amino-acid deacylase
MGHEDDREGRVSNVTTPPAPLLIAGGMVLDGSGAPATRLEVLLHGGVVVEMGESVSTPAGTRLIDAQGMLVAPGFIDLHTHCDFSLPLYPRAESMVRQGVTTLVVGNCGHSTFPVREERLDLMREYSAFLGGGLSWDWRTAADFRGMLEALPLSVNVVLQVGHGSVRTAVMGFDARAAGDDELADMEREVQLAFDAGCFGISSGLIYAPGTYAGTDELVALATVAARNGGFYSTHMRNEGPALLAAVDEAIDVARRSGAGLQLSHHKVLGRRNWGLTRTSLATIDAARRDGMDILLDQYPYEASSTTMTALLPSWALEGGTAQMSARLADVVTRARIRTEVLDGPTDGRPKRDFEPETVRISSVGGGARRPELVGLTLAGIATARGCEPVDAMLDLLLDEGGGVEVVIFAIGPDDIRRVMSHPEVAIASDGWTLSPDAGGTPHPRSYGTFARVLGHYVRDEGVLSVEEAVRKMTSLPARRLGLGDRGVLRPGARADVVVFDPARVRDRATFEQPHQFCDGVSAVVVNGHLVVEAGEHTGAPGGRVLRRDRE